MMTHDRQYACAEYSTRNSCRGDKANNCVWLDDVLGDDSSSSKGKQQPAKTASAERASSAVPNLFTARMAVMQKEFGSSLRELLGRSQTPLVDPAMELLAEGAKPAASTPAAAAAPAAPSSSKPSSSSGGGKSKLKCTSRELIENFVYTQSGYSSVLQAPLAMHCPGSKAFNLVRCMGQTSNGERCSSWRRVCWGESCWCALDQHCWLTVVSLDSSSEP